MLQPVFDTSVIVAALRSRSGASNQLLQAVARRQLRLLVTTALFLEYEDVLKRPEQRLATGLSLAAIDQFLTALASASKGVEVHFRWRPQLRDPSDEMVLEAAVNGRASALVTHNIADFKEAAGRFGLHLCTPKEFLQEMNL